MEVIQNITKITKEFIQVNSYFSSKKMILGT